MISVKVLSFNNRSTLIFILPWSQHRDNLQKLLQKNIRNSISSFSDLFYSSLKLFFQYSTFIIIIKKHTSITQQSQETDRLIINIHLLRFSVKQINNYYIFLMAIISQNIVVDQISIIYKIRYYLLHNKLWLYKNFKYITY